MMGAAKVRTMKYYFMNTDFKSLKYSPHDIWIENGLAFTGGPKRYGELLEQLLNFEYLMSLLADVWHDMGHETNWNSPATRHPSRSSPSAIAGRPRSSRVGGGNRRDAPEYPALARGGTQSASQATTEAKATLPSAPLNDTANRAAEESTPKKCACLRLC
jgi:hypothetical protein